jgi:hypothetical protein
MLVERRDGPEDRPTPRRVVLRGSQHARPGRVEHCALDPFLMAAPHGEFGAGRGIPQPRRVCLSWEAVGTRAPDGSNTVLAAADRAAPSGTAAVPIPATWCGRANRSHHVLVREVSEVSDSLFRFFLPSGSFWIPD